MSELSRSVTALRKVALSYPDAAEDFRWGERTIKVRGKIFAFLSEDGEKLYLTVKLPQSSDAALSLPFTSRTRYRLGRSGWVSVRFPKGSAIAVNLTESDIDRRIHATGSGPRSLPGRRAPGAPRRGTRAAGRSGWPAAPGIRVVARRPTGAKIRARAEDVSIPASPA